MLDILEETENLTARKLQSPQKPKQESERLPAMHRLTFRDGFNFGCGFFVANLIAAAIIGVLALALTMITTLIGAAGMASMFQP